MPNPEENKYPDPTCTKINSEIYISFGNVIIWLTPIQAETLSIALAHEVAKPEDRYTAELFTVIT